MFLDSKPVFTARLKTFEIISGPDDPMLKKFRDLKWDTPGQLQFWPAAVLGAAVLGPAFIRTPCRMKRDLPHL